MSNRVIDISFPVNENILLSLKESKDEFVREMFISAIEHYKKRRLSLGKAAELAACDKIDFIHKLQKEEIDIFDYNEDELSEILDDAKTNPS